MAVIAITGGPGAPGATTTALALLLSWPLTPGRKVLLVECDPDGGAALAGALEGRVEAVYGLRNLAVADRRGLLAETLWDQLIDLSPQGGGDRLLLPGLTDPVQAAGLAYTWEPLVETLHALEPQGYDVLLDLGRSGAFGPSAVLARRADAVVATVRTTLRGLSSARPRLAALREDLESAGTGADALGLLVIAEGPYPSADITREFGAPVLGRLPYAVRTARVLSDGGDSTDRRFIRSELMRTARTAVDEIQALVQRRRLRLTPLPGVAPAGRAAARAEAPAAGAEGWSAAAESERQPTAYPGGESAEPGYAWGSPQEAVPRGYTAGGGQAYAPPSGQVYAPAPEPQVTDQQVTERQIPGYAGPGPAVPGHVVSGPGVSGHEMPGQQAAGPQAEGQAYGPQAYGPQAYAQPPYGQQAYGEQSFAGQVYGDQPYADQPHADQAYGDRAYGDRSYGDQRYGEQSYGEQLYAAQPYPGQGHPGQAHPAQGYAGQPYSEPAAGQGFAGPSYGRQAGPGPVQTGPVRPGQADQSGPDRPVQTGPVRPGQADQLTDPQQAQPQPYPPLAGIAPHPAAPETFRAPQDQTETQGEVLRAR